MGALRLLTACMAPGHFHDRNILEDPERNYPVLETKRIMTETIPFEITGKTGEIEFRKYPSIVLATTAREGDDTGFSLLFAFITGSNRTRDRIAMTAPVITSTRIA